jgi:hypothetical protein
MRRSRASKKIASDMETYWVVINDGNGAAVAMEFASQRSTTAPEEQYVRTLSMEFSHEADITQTRSAAGKDIALVDPCLVIDARPSPYFLDDRDFTVHAVEPGKDFHLQTPPQCRPRKLPGNHCPC